MKKNKQLFFAPIFLLTITGILVITGCSREIEELFDQSPQERIYEVIKNCNETLLKAPNGWKMNYQSGRGDKFLFLMKFNADNTVEMAADFTQETTTSTYSYSRIDGPVLTFDTYGLFHLLADPAITPSPGDKKGIGYAGDLEFIIQKVTPDSIILKGRKSYHRVKMVPSVAGDEKLLKEMESFSNFKRYLQNSKFFMALKSGDQLLADVDVAVKGSVSHFVSIYNNPPGGVLTFTYRENGEIVTKASDLVFNNAGFTLSEPLTIGGKTINAFVWDEDQNTFTLQSDKKTIITGSDITPFIREKALEEFLAINETVTTVYASDAVYNEFLLPIRNRYNDEKIALQFYFGRYSSLFNFCIYTPSNPMGDGKWAYLNTNPEIIDPNRPDIVHFKVNTKRPYYRKFWPEIIDHTEEGKGLYDFLTSPDGLLIYFGSDDFIYLILSTDSRYWVAFKKK